MVRYKKEIKTDVKKTNRREEAECDEKNMLNPDINTKKKKEFGNSVKFKM